MFEAVALLKDVPEHRLTRGQVGTVVEVFDKETVLVEFSAEDGKAFAVVTCARRDLLVLRYDTSIARPDVNKDTLEELADRAAANHRAGRTREL